MNHFLAPILVGLLLIVGCTSPGQSPSSDPFLLGTTRVPPPGTGEAAGRPADPAYAAPSSSTPPSPGWKPSGTPASPTPAAQPTSPPGFATKTPDSRGTPTGTFVPAAGSSTTTPAAASPTATPSRSGYPTSPGAAAPAPSVGTGVRFRGVSLQGSRPTNATPDYPPPTAMGGSPAGASADGRAPRPLDDGATGGNYAAPKPLAPSDAGNAAGLAPPPSNDPPARAADVSDPPTAL